MQPGVFGELFLSASEGRLFLFVDGSHPSINLLPVDSIQNVDEIDAIALAHQLRLRDRRPEPLGLLCSDEVGIDDDPRVYR